MRRRNRQLRGSWINIIQCLDRASSAVVDRGTEWYPTAHSEAIDIGKLAGYGGSIGLRLGAGIIASLSPQTDWDKNILYAKEIVRFGYAPRQTIPNNLKAIRILDGEEPLNVLGGMKVIPFFNAIVSPREVNAVPVVDRHAGSVYVGRSLTGKQQEKLSNVGVMTRIQGAYIKVARNKELHVHCVQGITWVQWRIEKGYDKA